MNAFRNGWNACLMAVRESGVVSDVDDLPSVNEHLPAEVAPNNYRDAVRNAALEEAASVYMVGNVAAREIRKLKSPAAAEPMPASEAQAEKPHDLTIGEAFAAVGGWMNGGDLGYPTFGSMEALKVYTAKMIRSYIANKEWREGVAAPVPASEAARRAYVKLTNSAQPTDNGGAIYIATQEMMRAFDAHFAAPAAPTDAKPDCCDTPNYCSAARRCTAKDSAIPTAQSVRDALEQAAKVCDFEANWSKCEADDERYMDSTRKIFRVQQFQAEKCANAIRALIQSPQPGEAE